METTNQDIINNLVFGRPDRKKITLLEGWNLKQVAGHLANVMKFEYDETGRVSRIITYNMDGNIEKTITNLYDEKLGRETKILTDASKKLIRRIEYRINSQNKKIIQATFDDKSRLIQKKTIGYDKHGNIARVHDYDMLKPSEQGKPILINIITYEYD